MEAGELAKRLPAVERLLEAASALRAERGDAWVAAGGGTTGDLVGTAAALYLRGAPLVQLPTTWLALSDSALGVEVPGPGVAIGGLEFTQPPLDGALRAEVE